MMLIEMTTVPALALPIAALKEHLRLGSGFAMAPDQDGLLEGYLRASMAAIEGRIAKALIARRFRWTLEAWRDPAEQALPIAPAGPLVAVRLVDAMEVVTVLPLGNFRLVADLHRPRLAGTSGTALPTVPTGGRVEVEFDAGFGAAWTDVPADLQQAVLLLAADFYERRHEGDATAGGVPSRVTSLIERWRTVRVLGGRGRR